MVKKLGGGAFGTVYLIRSKETLQLLAAKHQKVKQEKETANSTYKVNTKFVSLKQRKVLT